MIFIANSAGKIVNAKPETVYQGANGTNTIYLICPSLSHSSVTVAFKLPNGVVTDVYYMTHKDNIGGLNDEAALVQGWALDIPAIVTACFGVVTIQFTWYTAAGAVVASSSTTFRIARGVAPVLPEEPDSDVYTDILSALANIQSTVDSFGIFLSTDENANKSTTEIAIDTIDISENSIIQVGDYIIVNNAFMYRVTALDDEDNPTIATVEYLINLKGSDGLILFKTQSLSDIDGAITADIDNFNRTPINGDYFTLVYNYGVNNYLGYAKITNIDGSTVTYEIENSIVLNALIQTSIWVTDWEPETGSKSIPIDEISFNRTPIVGDCWAIVIESENGGDLYMGYATITAIYDDTYKCNIFNIANLTDGAVESATAAAESATAAAESAETATEAADTAELSANLAIAAAGNVYIDDIDNDTKYKYAYTVENEHLVINLEEITDEEAGEDSVDEIKTLLTQYKILICIRYSADSDYSYQQYTRAQFMLNGYLMQQIFSSELYEKAKSLNSGDWLEITDYISLYELLSGAGYTNISNALPASGIHKGYIALGLFATSATSSSKTYYNALIELYDLINNIRITDTENTYLEQTVDGTTTAMDDVHINIYLVA